jgi:hypothetical protein
LTRNARPFIITLQKQAIHIQRAPNFPKRYPSRLSNFSPNGQPVSQRPLFARASSLNSGHPDRVNTSNRTMQRTDQCFTVWPDPSAFIRAPSQSRFSKLDMIGTFVLRYTPPFCLMSSGFFTGDAGSISGMSFSQTSI